MKRILNRLCVVATAMAMSFVLSQCTKDNTKDASDEQVYVTLTASKGDLTKADLAKSETDMAVTWSSGDKLYVVGAKDGLLGNITLTSGAGATSAKFEGYLTYTKSKQDIHFYYVGKTASVSSTTYTLDLSSQAGTLDGIENTMHVMRATVSGVAAGIADYGTITMSNLISIIKVNTFTPFGEVSGIVITGANATASIDLKTGTVTPATGSITLTGTADTDYYIAILPDITKQVLKFTHDNHEANLRSKVIVEGKYYTNSGLGVVPLDGYCEEGFYYGRGTEIDGVIWAPVNCGIGYDYAYPFGKLYQWGRKAGGGYNDGSTYIETNLQEKYPTENTQVNGTTVIEQAQYYYWGANLGIYHDWLAAENVTRWNRGTEYFPEKGAYDPCPTGWRIPTKTEFDALIGNHTAGLLQDGCGEYAGMKGKYFDGSTTAEPSSGVFLPAAGCRDCLTANYLQRNTIGGYYWSSTPGESSWSYYLTFYNDGALTYNYFRANGYSIRCVKEAGSSIESMENVNTSW